MAVPTGSYGSTDLAGDSAKLTKKRDPWETHQRRVAHNVLVGAHLPSLLFVILVCLFTYVKHHLPVLPWLVALLGGILIVIGSYPTAPKGIDGRKILDYLPLLVSCVSIALGILFGVWNSSNIEAYFHATYLNRYNGVLPDTNPLSVSDGGILDFAKGTVVDIESSAGYHAWPNTYCAAPIVMSDSGDDDQPIGFWAVGMNCCDPRGRFACDDADVKQARSGLLVNDHPLGSFTGHDVKDFYVSAVRMAAAEYGLEAAPNPVLVAWLERPLDTADWSLKIATFIFVALTILAFGSCWSMQMILIQIGRFAS